MSSNIDEVARQFVAFYYQTFTSNRANLGSLYQEHSMLTFEGQQVAGTSNIVSKLTALPITTIQPQIDTLDAQPSHPSAGSILIFITGRMQVDQESQPMRFSQTFQLLPSGGTFYIFNDIFRLNYG